MHSDPNVGRELFVRFPFIFAPDETRLKHDSSGERQPRILLVEDNEINQVIMYLLLSKKGITIDIAQNGLEGINSHRRNSYDLIFMDMEMPIMDGITATKQIRAFDKDVQIVALTANPVAEDKARALEAGMSDFLSKPLDHFNLENILIQARKNLRH